MTEPQGTSHQQSTASVPPASRGRPSKSAEEESIQNRVAEMKMIEAKKEAEKKLKREQRMMKMMQQQETADVDEQQGQEVRAKRILETIQDEEEAEARVLQVRERTILFVIRHQQIVNIVTLKLMG